MPVACLHDKGNDDLHHVCIQQEKRLQVATALAPGDILLWRPFVVRCANCGAFSTENYKFCWHRNLTEWLSVTLHMLSVYVQYFVHQILCFSLHEVTTTNCLVVSSSCECYVIGQCSVWVLVSPQVCLSWLWLLTRWTWWTTISNALMTLSRNLDRFLRLLDSGKLMWIMCHVAGSPGKTLPSLWCMILSRNGIQGLAWPTS